MTDVTPTPKTDIAEMFARDPLKLTNADIGEMVTVFRSSRHLFNAGNKQAGATKTLSPAKKEVAEAAGSTSLKDLGLAL